MIGKHSHLSALHLLQICFASVAMICLPLILIAQDCNYSVAINQQNSKTVSGNVDFTIIGNSQNPHENNDLNEFNCGFFTPSLSTSSELILPENSQITGAYLYWAGTGDVIENVQLNSQTIIAEKCWNERGGAFNENTNYFSAYSDVTELVKNFGEGQYIFSGLNNSELYDSFSCIANSTTAITLFGGWALVVIYENESLAGDYTVFYFDGFRNFQNQTLNVNLQTNVFEHYENSHVGIVAWEGDKDPDIKGDNILLNQQLLPSAGYSDSENIFNGTNSFTDPLDATLYNMDIDNFDASDVVQSNINTEGADFSFELTSGDDLILLNTLLFRIPNQAPDATVELPTDIDLGCTESKEFQINYSYKNTEEASKELDPGLQVNFYLNDIDGTIIGTDFTEKELQAGQSATETATLVLPDDYLGEFKILAYIDDPSNQQQEFGARLELEENNNIAVARGKIDQNYLNIRINAELCEGDSFYIHENEIKTSGEYPFNLKTKVGNCDSTGIITITVHKTYDEIKPLVTICESEKFELPSGKVVSPEPRNTPYLYKDTSSTIYGCDSIITTQLQVQPLIKQTHTATICLGEQYQLPSNKKVSEPGTYIDTISSTHGNNCRTVLQTTLKVINLQYPSAFSPNANKKNETFKALVPDCSIQLENFHLLIFNKWGEKVFETRTIEEGWEGNNINDIIQTGHFIWQATYDTPFQSNIKQTGGVTLLK